MAIREEGTNFPRVLGWKTRPYHIVRKTRIGEQPMVLVGGETPVHMAQKVAEPCLSPRCLLKSLATQVRGKGLPLMSRPTPILDLLQSQEVTYENVIGVAPSPPNIPTPYVRIGTWPPEKRVAEIPSVVGVIAGPSRTIHPQRYPRNLSIET